MKFYYFVDKEGVRQGPLPLDDLSAYDISPTTLVWTKGMEKWMKAKDVADFFDFFKTEEDSNDDQNADSVIESSESSNSQLSLSKEKLSENASVPHDVENDNSYKKYGIILIVILLLIVVFFSFQTCNNSTDNNYDFSDSIMVVHDTVVVDKGVEIIDFIKSTYNDKKYEDYAFLKQYCTNRMLNKLRREYEYDGDGYAVWLFRSGAQDGPSDEYRIISVAPEENNWYTYSYYDMGIKGINRVKIIKDGDILKIDDIETINIENTSFTQDDVADTNVQSFSFTGYVDEKYEIRGTLNIDNDVITGKYCYESSIRKYGDSPSLYITLRGSIDSYNHVNIVGTTSKGQEERWIGILSRNDYGEISFIGTFYGSDDKEFSISFSNI